MELEWSEAPNDVEEITLNDFYKLEDENTKLRDALEEIIELVPPQHQHDYPAVNIAQQALDEVDNSE